MPNKRYNFGGLIDPLEEAKRIADSGASIPFNMYGGGPLDPTTGTEYEDPMKKASRKVKEAVERFDKRPVDKRISAKEALPKMYRDFTESDELDRKEKEKLEEEERQARRDADRAYEDKVLREAEEKAGISKSNKEMDYALSEVSGNIVEQHEFFRKMRDTIGDLLGMSTSTHASSVAGDIKQRQQEIRQAEAFKRKQDLQRQLETLIHDRDNYIIPSEGSNKDFQEHINFYNGLIEQIQQQLQDPDLNQLSNLYMADYVQKESGLWDSIGNWMQKTYGNTLGSLTILPSQKEAAIKNQHDYYINKLASRYDEFVNNRLQSDESNQSRNNQSGNMPNGQYTINDVTGEQTDRDKALGEINKKYDSRNIAADKYIKDRQKEISADQEEYTATLKANQWLDDVFAVSDEYKTAKQAYQNAPWYNPGYWFYQVPGLIGSSNSSYNQVLGNLLEYGGLAASLALAPVSGGASLAAYTTGVVGATPFQAAGVFEENKAEIDEKKIKTIEDILQDPDAVGSGAYDRVINNLHFNGVESLLAKGFTKEQIEKRYGSYEDTPLGAQWMPNDEQKRNLIQDYTAGLINSNDPALRKANFESSKGLQALYEANNIRTGGELLIQKVIEFPPTGAMARMARGIGARTLDRIGERVAARHLQNEIVTDEAGRVTSKVAGKTAETTAEKAASTVDRYSNGFRKATPSEAFGSGFEAGASAAAMAGHGIAGTTIAGVATGTANAALNIAKRALKPSQRAFIDKFEETIFNKYQRFYDNILGDKDWAKLMLSYGVKQAKSTAIGAAQEGAEEAVQYMNSLEDYASKYGFDGMNLSDLIANDIVQGNEVANAYLSLLGLSHSEFKNDAEFWQNWQGGAVLGGAKIGSLRVPFTGVNGLYKDIRTQDILAHAAEYNREADKISRASYRSMASEIMNGRAQSVHNVLDNMEKQDSRREDPQYTQEAWDAQKKAARGIEQLVKNKDIRTQLEKKGIQFGTTRYATAIADIYTLQQQSRENTDAHNRMAQEINSAYLSEDFSAAVEERVKEFNDDPLGKRSKYEARKEIARKAREAELARAKEAEEDVESAEFKAHLDLIEKEAFDNSDQTVEDNVRNNLRIRARYENKLLGLLKVKGQQNTIEDWYNIVAEFTGLKALRPDARTIRDNIEKQIKETKAALHKMDSSFDDSMSDGDVINWINNDEDYIGVDSENIQQLESALSMVGAESAVTEKYISTLWEDNDRYSRKIDAIIKAEDDNARLDTMINDVYAGDVVTHLYDVFNQEDKEAAKQRKKEALEKARAASAEAPSIGEAPSATETVKSTEEKAKAVTGKLAKNKAAYEAKKQKARDAYNRRKNRYNKSRRGRLSSTIPFENLIVSSVNSLISNAEMGVYKIQQLVNDAKDIYDDLSIDDIIPILKQQYIKAIAKYQYKKPAVLANMSSIEEVLNYALNKVIKRPYIVPSTSVMQAGKYVQKKLEESRGKIIQTVSSYYDVFVDNNGTVEIYPNVSQIQLDAQNTSRKPVFDDIVSKLRAANTSDESFRQALYDITRPQAGFPVDEYVKYRNVDGAIEAAARNTIMWGGNDYIEDGIAIAHIIANVFAGEQPEIIGNTSDYNLFISALNDIKNQLEAQGYSLIDTNNTIYGTDLEGNKISATVDAIFINNKTGDLYVIDVKSSYLSTVNGWNKPVAAQRGIMTTIGESLTQNARQIDDILSTGEFQFTVERFGVLPVLWSGRRSGHIKLDNPIIPISTRFQERTALEKASLEEYKNKAQNIVNDINQLRREYNYIIGELRAYDENFNLPIQDVSELVEQSDKESYQVYIQTIAQQYDDLVEEVNELRDKLYGHINEEQLMWHEINMQQEPAQVDQTQEDLLVRLTDACTELDNMLDLVPVKRVTTQTDKENVKKLYQAIFDAQVALNDYIEHDPSNTIDITREEELIASAMERLAESNENFGRLNIFVKRWWLNNFSKGVTDNTSELISGDFYKFQAYRTKIQSWIQTLQQHVLEDLDNHPLLQEWYSSLLNNYFTVLLDNFEQLISKVEDPAAKLYAQDLIQDGRDLIEYFNNEWPTSPDSQLQGPPQGEEETINQMPVRWKDHYNMSESHSPAFDVMRDQRKAYWHVSQKPDFLESYVIGPAEINNDPQHKPVFTLFVDGRDGKVKLHFQYWDKQENKKKFGDLPFEIDINAAQGHATQDQIDWFKHVNRANRRFTDKVKAALEYVKKHPGKKLSFRLSLNKGTVEYERVAHNVFEWLFTGDKNGKDMYTVRLSRQGRLGITKFTVDKVNDRIFYDVFSGEDLSQRIGSLDDTFRKQHSRLQSGMIVYFYNMGDGQTIPIPVVSAPIGQIGAQQIVSLLKQYARGNRYDDQGFDIMELLKMRLHFMDPARKLSEFNKINNTVFSINGTKIQIGTTTYDIFNDETALLQKFASMSSTVNAELLNENMAFTQHPVISRMRQMFVNDAKLNSVTLSNGFVLNRDDFEHNNTDGTSGSTWLGYLMRKGLLFTTAKGTGYRQLNIHDVKIVNENDDQPIQQQDFEKRESGRRRAAKSDWLKNAAGLGLSDKLFMTVPMEELETDRTQAEKDAFTEFAKAYFKQVLGIDEYKSVEDAILKKMPNGMAAIGATTSTLIALSTYAPYTAVYHEAFHKVMELLMPADVRNEFYTIYRNHNGQNLSERQVAEGLADMFVDYTERMVNYKKLGWAKKILKFYEPLRALYNLSRKSGFFNTVKFITMYRNMNAGKFKTNEVSEENKQRFKEKFDDVLYYTVKNYDTGDTADFVNIADSSDLNEAINALEYYVLEDLRMNVIDPDFDAYNKVAKHWNKLPDYLSPETLADLTGKGVPDDELILSDLVFREIFEPEYQELEGKKGKRTVKSYPKFAVISKKLADAVAARLSDYDGRIKDLPEDEDEDEKVQKQNIDKYDRASYEFRKIDSATKRAKLFFATVPYRVWSEDGKSTELDYTRNKYNCPVLMPLTEVYNRIVNDLHYIKNHFELLDELEKKAETSPMYKYVHQRYKTLMDEAYQYDDNRNIIGINYDKEALALQIAQTVSSQKVNFIIAKSKNLNDLGKEVTIINSSENRDERSYPKQWTQNLLSGLTSVFERTTKDGKYVLTKRAQGANNTDIFHRAGAFFNNLREIFSNSADEFTFNGQACNKLSYQDIELVKYSIVNTLNTLGITMSKEAFDYMLEKECQGIDGEALGRFFTRSSQYDSMQSFINMLNSFVYQNGDVNQEAVKQAYIDKGFVSLLAKYQGAYQRISVDQSALALNGKKYYTITQDNTISYITNLLSQGNMQDPFIQRLMNFSYVYDKRTKQGSIIQRAIASGEKPNLSCATYIGFKTDNRGDQGNEYSDEATVEDFMAKASMLQQGYLVPPTLADKGTFTIIGGVKIPGMQLSYTKDSKGNKVWSVQNAPTIMWVGDTPYIRPTQSVLSQFIEYANTERLAIQQCMEDLGYEEIDGYEKQGRRKLKENEKIKNYHTSRKDGVEPNGTRFLSLTQIVVKEGDKLVTYNLNDPRMSSNDLLKLANEKFFSKSLQEQEDIMAYTLAIQTDNAIEFALNHGIIERTSQEKVGTGEIISKNDKRILNLSSKHLNQLQINVVADAILASIPKWANTAKGPQRTLYENLCKSMAIAAILGDIQNRSIISSQECLRNFIGHPAMFKVDYDIEAGKIKDSTYDIQKRIGGLISTGDNNMTNIPGFPRSYRCAECKDYEVGSTSQIASRLDELFENGAIREAYALATNDWSTAYESDINDIKNTTLEHVKAKINKAIERAKTFASAYKKGINVADGAAYITADMCKNLLRMRGAFNGDVEEAFNILTGDQAYSWMDKKEAYNKIYDAVNIVTTKYTAYGFRTHTLNGDGVSDVAVPYYNKFALFPLFDCIATGPMKGIYGKMRNEKVDMLLMDSAVKLGSQGAVEFDGESINEPFNVYEQDFGFLRRQLNTDPEEGDTIAVGTQMIKIGLSNLRLLRPNYMFNGSDEEVDGQTLLDRFMGSIKALSEIGEQELTEMFMTNGVVDANKLADYLQDQLTSRNANKALIEAIRVENGELVAPLASTPDATWIESIVISTVNKRVIDITTPGSSFVQRSVFATENTRKDGEGHIQGDAKLQMINEEGSMDAKISIDYFESILPKGLSFNEARQWLIDNGIIGPNAHANTIGYRIPTQAQSSIHALRFIDVIPAVKTTIILPEEFTKITGSDFDIDHLYLMSYNYKKGEDGKLTNKFDSQTEAKKYHQNMIMDCMMTLLKDTENSTHSLYKSIDNDTDLAKDVADKIPVFGSNKHKAFNFGALTEQVERKNDYITGKKGIGPFALNVTNQILTYLYNIQFKDTKFCEETGIWKLDHLEDWDDNSIQAWLGAFINGHVDIVKDPWVSKLNVNPFTYNMLNLLLRSGFGEVALWFLSQPIIRDMAAASDNAQSQFLRDPYKDGSVWKAREKAILEAVKMYVPESKLTPEYINEFLNEKDPTRRINAVNFLKENVSQLERIATGKEILGEQDVQETVFFAWKALEKYAAALGAFVQHSKIDTRKHGKSLIEIANYMDGYNKIFHPEGADRQGSLWDLDSLDHFARHSWLEQKTRAAISWPFKILHGQTFNGNESFMKMCISICRTLVGKNGTISTDLLQLISRHMQTKIKSKYFLDYARNYLQMSDEDITGLFVGDFTIAKRLNNLKYAIQHFEQYNRLANNRLLNQIMPVNQSEPITVTNENKKQDTIERPQFITVLDNVDSSRINSDDLIDGWVDLLNDSDKNVKKFARDLIVYAFLTSGEFKGWNKLFKYVPPQWLRGQIDTDFKPYSKFVKEELLSTFASSEDDIDEIVSNNDTDFKIVKTMKDEDEDGNENFVAKTHLVLIGRQRTKKEDIDELPVYISVDNPMESNRNRNGKNLFKLVDMYHGYPVYMRMRHKGYHYGNTDIYEYGWTFEYLENGLRQSRLTDYQSMYEKAQRYIDSLDNHAVDEFEQNPEEVAGAIIKAALYSEDNTVETDQVLTPQEIVEQEMPNEEGEYDWEYLEDSIDTGLLDNPILRESQNSNSNEHEQC